MNKFVKFGKRNWVFMGHPLNNVTVLLRAMACYIKSLCTRSRGRGQKHILQAALGICLEKEWIEFTTPQMRVELCEFPHYIISCHQLASHLKTWKYFTSAGWIKCGKRRYNQWVLNDEFWAWQEKNPEGNERLLGMIKRKRERLQNAKYKKDWL